MKARDFFKTSPMYDSIEIVRDSAEPKHEHQFTKSCWVCEASSNPGKMCDCGVCTKCGEPTSSLEVQRQQDEVDRERRRTGYPWRRR